MIIGSGLLARAFSGVAASQLGDVTIYAAGVSNSRCGDEREFLREKCRLLEAITCAPKGNLLVYFSTCGVYEDARDHSPYVRHKLAMEALVRARSRHAIFRLPQVVGSTPNPHTLTNHLFARMIRSERFQVWAKATRNILDIEDAVALVVELIRGGVVDETINIANPHSVPMHELIRSMEMVLGVRGVYDTLDQGAGYVIDIARIRPAISRLGLRFGDDYIAGVIAKYYGGRRAI